MDSLGDRMKSYEDNTRLEKGVVLIRVDGKAFHTWTRRANLNRPFDALMKEAMIWTTAITAGEMQGFRLAYTQSDEATFAIANLGENSGAWFDYKVQKLVSITSAIFTYHFNRFLEKHFLPAAFFDARAFSIPVEDAANNFVWRQQDNNRNYVQAWAHAKMPSAEVRNKSNRVLSQELEANGHSLNGLPSWVRYGTFVDSTFDTFSNYLSYDELNSMMGFEELVDAAN